MGKILAAYGGGFKPPTGGHFEIVKRALQDFPEIDEFTVFVGGKVRDGIEQTEAVLVWDIYKRYLANKVKIEPVKSPIGEILRLAKNNPQDIIYFVIGYREGRQDDLDDVSARTGDLEKKYPNIVVKVIPTYDPNMSGTNARKALNVSEKEFIKFLPNEVEEKSEIYSILRPPTNESLNENATYSEYIDYKQMIADLVDYMIENDRNILPLPDLEFIDGDNENAKNFFGRTAYYDPNTKTIVLYTEGRHPKDIVRSFAHEMVHHTQNLENRIGNLYTTDTTASEDLDAIEREAYLEGNMIFRNWTDSIDGDINSSIEEGRKKKKDPKKGTGKKPEGSKRRLYTDEDPKDTIGIKFSTRQDIVDTLNKKSFKAKSHARQSQIINLIHQRVRAAYGRAKDPDVKKRLKTGLDYITKKKEASKKKTQRLKKQKNENVAPNHDGKAAPYGSGYEEVKEGDTYEKMAAKGKKSGNLKQGTVRKRLGIPKDKKIPLSKINKEISRLKKMDKDKDKKGVQLGDKNQKYYKALQLSKTLKTTTNVNEKKDYFGLNQFIKEVADEVLNEGKYDSLVTKLAGFTLNAWKGDFKDGQSKGYFELEVGPGREFDYPHLFFNYKAKANFVDDFKSGGVARPMMKIPEVELNYRIPSDELPRMWEQISMDIRNTIRHEIEHLMQSGPNTKQGKEMKPDYREREELKTGKKPWWKIWRKKLGTPDYYKLEKEIDANLQGLYLKAKKSREPLKNVINNYLQYDLNLSIEDQNDIKDLWRERAPKLNIPLLENEEKYKIFSDMDGVLTDFNKSFKKYSDGIAPSDYEKKYGKEKFWELIDGQGKVGFWVGMPWMEDGKQYWDYIKNYDTELLSSPSRSATSRLGKRLWVRNNMPGVKLTLAQAAKKQNYAAPNHILIDDRKSNIDQWISQGGIGILHTSAADTISQLKKLGL